VEVIRADDTICVIVAELQVDVQGGLMQCLMRRDLMEYDYVSVGWDGFVPISVKPVTSVTRLTSDVV
jgi:predicted DNA-binding transcriptional regulator